MNAGWQVKALQAADEMERQAQVLREAVRIMDGRTTAKSQQAFGGKIAQAMKLTDSPVPAQRGRGRVLNAVKELLASGPKTLKELQAGLDSLVPTQDVSARLQDMTKRGHLTCTGKYASRVYSLKQTAQTRHSSNDTGPIYPITLPRDLTTRQRRALSGYLIHQIVSAADEPVSLASILASLRAGKQKVHPTMVSAALRRGFLRKGPGFSSKNRTYVAGELPPAFQAG